MPAAALLQIESGSFGLELVDPAEVGYSADWQAPGGIDVTTATGADYTTGFMCQVTAGTLTPSADTTTADVPATFCQPASSIPTPGETSYNLDVSFLQDPQIVAGLSRYLFEHDTKEAYFYLGFDGDNPPKAIGRVRLNAGAIGGAARTTLTADVSLPLSKKPQILFGDLTLSEAVPPTTVAATGATAGTPGTWTPAGSTPPADAAGATAAAIVASPLTAWALGEYVQGSTAGAAGEMYWNATAWTAGKAV